ncbi:MAG: DUF1343 domain-containing protein [Leptospira sp.]|nr:DUF1343 domain-containing protein [Leptospira sp.]
MLLVTNPSGIGVNPENLKAEFRKNGAKITTLIGLEHGFLGLDEDFSNSPVTIDPIFNLPIYHIYRLKRSEIATLIREVDAIVFDVQDMSMRCYTYLTVLKRIMDQINDNSRQLIILDHISPGMEMQPAGTDVRAGFENFAGEFPLLFFTGLSLGESARFYNTEYLEGRINLKVIPVEKYSRKMSFEETGLRWNTPSPNLPGLDSARNYFALVFLEGINVSVGRGTAAPFIYFGAPWFKNPEKLVQELEKEEGETDFYFSVVFFKPVYGPYKDVICRGLRMTIVNRLYDPIKLGYRLVQIIKSNYGKNFNWVSFGKTFHLDNLWGNDSFRKAIDAGMSYKEFHKTFEEKEINFRKKVRNYHIY